MNDYKKRVQNAIDKYHKRQERVPRRTNQKPEKHITKPQVLLICKQLGFMIYEIEASTYNPITKIKSSYANVPAGWPDLCGIGPNGEALFIELKAPGRRSNLSEDQYYFLFTAINHNAFAVVVDSGESLKIQWSQWILDSKDKSILLQNLPKKHKNNTDFFID
jgi:hypothetical protein